MSASEPALRAAPLGAPAGRRGRPASAGAVLDGRLRRLRDLHVVEAPVEVLGGRGAAKARATLAGIPFLAHVFRLPETAAVVVPPEVCVAAGVGLGDRVELWLDAARPERPGTVPVDVAATLAGARADISVLSRQERRQSLLLIKEAASPEVRRARIDALVAACASKAATTAFAGLRSKGTTIPPRVSRPGQPSPVGT